MTKRQWSWTAAGFTVLAVVMCLVFFGQGLFQDKQQEDGVKNAPPAPVPAPAPGPEPEQLPKDAKVTTLKEEDGVRTFELSKGAKLFAIGEIEVVQYSQDGWQYVRLTPLNKATITLKSSTVALPMELLDKDGKKWNDSTLLGRQQFLIPLEKGKPKQLLLRYKAE